MIISRELINPNIIINGMTYEKICHRINKFKHMFLDRGMNQNDSITVTTLNCSTDYYAALFAAWELGMKVITCSDRILKTRKDAKHMLDAVEYMITTISKAFRGYQEFCVHDLNKPLDPNNSGGLTRMDLKDGLYADVINLYNHWENEQGTDNVMLMDDVAPYPGTPIQPWEVSEDSYAVMSIDPCMDVKEVDEWWHPDYFTHKQIIESVKQYSFPYKKCAMSRTIHHNRCIDYYFLPALMNCEEIFDVTLMDHTERPEEAFIYEYVTDYAVKAVREHEIERILFPDPESLEFFKSKLTEPFTHEVLYNVGKQEISSKTRVVDDAGVDVETGKFVG